MNDLMNQPQIGLRRRRRAIPDEINEPFLGAAWDNNNRNVNNDDDGDDDDIPAGGDVQEIRRGRRLVTPPPPVNTQQHQAWTRRSPPSDTSHNTALASWRVSQVYCLVSTIFAILAIILAPVSTLSADSDHFMSSGSAFAPASTSTTTTTTPWSSSVEQVAKAAAVGMAAKRGDEAPDTNDILQSIQHWWNSQQQEHQTNPPRGNTDATQQQQQQQQHLHVPSPFWWWKHNRQQKDGRARPGSSKTAFSWSASFTTDGIWATLADFARRWMDPSLWDPSSPTLATDIIDKILTSTLRLLAIANFLLAMTYLVHSAVASWFLGDQSASRATNAAEGGGPAAPSPPAPMVDWSSPTRERMGGFLVFKLLLISAVVAPDTLDLLILLTWYTTLSCLRSLDHLAHTTTTHLNAMGQPPRPGVIQLLVLVLVGNSLAAASCVALFHAAGWGMVLLLTCDCALLAADVVSHILKYFTCVLEDLHSHKIQALEARQLRLHNAINNSNNISETEQSVNEQVDGDFEEIHEEDLVGDLNVSDAAEGVTNSSEDDTASQLPISREELLEESRRLDQRMEVLDLAHARSLSIMDNVMFALELFCHVLTVVHFCHIWSLHGVQFTLIDGVLALHLHSAISTACKKIAQRRNIHSIARDLQVLFPNASDQELRKASLAGDVCCICLGTMSTGGHVKKVPCGHLYHTHCLREVVERAQSVQAAKCPLCRSCLLNGIHHGPASSRRNVAATAAPAAPVNGTAGTQPAAVHDANGNDLRQQQQQQAQAANGADHALFRFSTEGILPAWLPVPAFSFEVVRRPSGPVPPPASGAEQWQEQSPAAAPIPDSAAERPAEMDTGPAAVSGNNTAPGPRAQNQRQQQNQGPSFLRRFLIMAGAVPMSPEEEARALAQLVDMFPQYERSHLLRELRERGSAEAVAEAILMGVFFSGVPRGE